MAKLDYNPLIDPTLEAMNKAMELEKSLEPPRHYLGASEIGHECNRYLFYSFRNACKRVDEAPLIKTIDDGHAQEALTIKRLRALPYIELINTDGTFDKDGNPNQIGFQSLLGHFCGHVDGVIHGLLQAPKTWHVFEHKCKEKKFLTQLMKLITEKGEKNALREFDYTYYCQAIIYMHELELERHYCVVAAPGGRDHISVRTDYNRKEAELILEKAKNIIFENWTIPAKLSESREFYKCNWCHMKGVCHDGDMPDVHCKSCRYRECVDGGKSLCLATDTIIEDTLLNVGCAKHIYNPALLPQVKLIEHQEDGCLYQVEGKDFFFSNTNLTGFPEVKDRCDAIFTSKQLKEDIKNISNIDNKMVKEFKGTVIPQEQAKKAWDKSNKWEI